MLQHKANKDVVERLRTERQMKDVGLLELHVRQTG